MYAALTQQVVERTCLTRFQGRDSFSHKTIKNLRLCFEERSAVTFADASHAMNRSFADAFGSSIIMHARSSAHMH